MIFYLIQKLVNEIRIVSLNLISYFNEFYQL